MQILAKFGRNWADEFDCDGFALFTPEEWESAKEALSTTTDWHFGTNEGWEDEGPFIDDISVEEISDTEASVLRKLFPELNRTVSEGTYEYDGKTLPYRFVNGGYYGIFPPTEKEDEEE